MQAPSGLRDRIETFRPGACPVMVAGDGLQRTRRRLLWIQSVITLTVAMIFLVAGGWQDALAALFGGAITVIGSAWMGRRVRQAGELATEASNRAVVKIYGAAVERFALVLAALAIGLGVLRLSPLPLLLAFAISHLGYIAAAFGYGRR